MQLQCHGLACTHGTGAVAVRHLPACARRPLPEVEATVEREMDVLSQAMSQAPTPLPPCPRGDHALAWDRSGKLLLAGHELSPHHAEHHHGGRKLAIGIHVRWGFCTLLEAEW